MTRPISDLDVPLSTLRDQIAVLVERQSVDRAVTELRALLAAPPNGPGAQQQPTAWYEAVFDQLACAHPECLTCTPEETP